jgi:hypothetical protein
MGEAMKGLGFLATIVVAIVGPVSAADVGSGEARTLGYSLTELHAALPNIPEDQLSDIVFRIPTITSIMDAYRAKHPVQSVDVPNISSSSPT